MEDKDIPLSQGFIDSFLKDLYQTLDIKSEQEKELVKQDLPSYIQQYEERLDWLKETTAVE